jgi:hypothetical protein
MQDTMQDTGIAGTMMTPVTQAGSRPAASRLESGLGAWASAISADDNAQAAIALAEAINRARTSQAGRENRAADARVIAVSRLETLRARLAPVYAAIPRDVELFDLGMVGHAPPRLFVDIIAFVEMADDGRGFRLMQQTRAGRVMLGETSDEKQMTGLVTDYIAERLVERERALAAQGIHLKPPALPKAAVTAPAASTEAVSPAPNDAPGTPPADVPASDPTAAAPAAQAFVAPAPVAQVSAVQPQPRPEQAQGATTTAALRRDDRATGGWVWPLLSLIVGIGLGALALYLYAASLARP